MNNDKRSSGSGNGADPSCGPRDSFVLKEKKREKKRKEDTFFPAQSIDMYDMRLLHVVQKCQ